MIPIINIKDEKDLDTHINNIEFICNAIIKGNENLCIEDILNEVDNIRKKFKLKGVY
jgi:hypothetical protein